MWIFIIIMMIMKGDYRLRQRKGRKVEVLFLGRDNWISSGCDNKKDASIWAEANKALYVHVDGKDPYVKDYAWNFWTRRDGSSIYVSNKLRNKHYGDQYYELCHGRTTNYIIPAFGRYRLSQITPLMVDRWFLSLESVYKGKPLSDNTKNKVLKTLSLMYDEAIRNELVYDNPCKHIRCITESHEERPVLTDEEMELLFPEEEGRAVWVWQGLMWACYFNVMRCTGFRPGEVAGLKVENYHKELGGVFTTASVDSTTKELKQSIKTTNKGKKYKVGLLDSLTQSLLDKHIASLPQGEDMLFRVNGGVIVTSTSNKHFVGCLKRMGIEVGKKSQYSIRHTFMTSLIGEIDSNVVKELMGHTGYREEYDHRKGEKRLKQLQSIRKVIEDII